MYIQRPLIAAMLAAGLLAACGGDDNTPTADQQARDLLAQMTLDERFNWSTVSVTAYRLLSVGQAL